MGTLLVVFPSVQMALVACIMPLYSAVCCSHCSDYIVNDAVVDLHGSIFTKNRDWAIGREFALLESLDDGGIAWIEFCELLSDSLCG